MTGTTLSEIHDRIESLADEDGDYYLVCGRYGDRPVPAADLRSTRGRQPGRPYGRQNGTTAPSVGTIRRSRTTTLSRVRTQRR